MDEYIMENVRRADFQVGLTDSYGELIEDTLRNVVIMWNRVTISDEEALGLINSGRYEYDERVVVMTPKQADNLGGKINDN